MFLRAFFIALISWFFCIPQSLAEEHIPSSEPTTSPQAAPAIDYEGAGEDAGGQIRSYREENEQQRLEREKEHEQRTEEARKRQELREQSYAERVDAYLKQREERQAQTALELEERRKLAEERRDELVEQHQAMLQRALERQDREAEHYEAMRLRAEQRQAELAAHRRSIEGMSPAERRAYIDENLKDELRAPERPRRRYERRPRWKPHCMHESCRRSYPRAMGEEGSEQ